MSPQQARDFFIQEFKTVLVSPEEIKEGMPLKTMTGGPMVITLKPEAKPFARHTPNSIPFAWRDKVKDQLDLMCDKGIISPVPDDEPTEWCHVLVCVAKSNGEPRPTVDLTHLNHQVIRDAHPFPTPHEVLRSVPPGAKFFSKMDCMMGYWQIPLAEESQHLTTFITPWGSYWYLVVPKGLKCSSDNFTDRMDLLFLDF